MSIERELTRNRKADAALENERVTRSRVDRLEQTAQLDKLGWKQVYARLGELEAYQVELQSRSFWGRLKWLVQGK